jgi:hypothetical protein
MKRNNTELLTGRYVISRVRFATPDLAGRVASRLQAVGFQAIVRLPKKVGQSTAIRTNAPQTTVEALSKEWGASLAYQWGMIEVSTQA